ncbi:MAG: Ig-like domain-containing protein [Imperialibacter sp.]|uniref:Ig-like domain-containing protein n=1 Tax=Imperialibacter sp. TaxID=2038411 RepID=UPI003A88CECD
MKKLLLFFLLSSAVQGIAQTPVFKSITPSLNLNGGWIGIRKGVVASNGDYYIIGYFNGAVDFDPGPNVVNAPDPVNFQAEDTYNDAFIAKYSSTDALLWVKAMWTRGPMISHSGQELDPLLFLNDITIGADGNVYFIGDIKGTADGIGAQVTGLRLTAGEFTRAFVRGLDPTGSLIFSAANTYGAGINIDYSSGEGIAVDGSGNVFITGHQAGTVNGNYSGPQLHAYYAKFNSSGVRINQGWMIQSPTGALDYNANRNSRGNAIAVDESGNIYLTGFFGQNADFDPGAGTNIINSVNLKDAFIAKWTSSNALSWVRTYSTASEGTEIELDGNGNVYAAVGNNFIKLTNAGTDRWNRNLGYAHSFTINANNELLVARTNTELRFLKLSSANVIAYEIAPTLVSGDGTVANKSFVAEYDNGNVRWINNSVSNYNYGSGPSGVSGNGIFIRYGIANTAPTNILLSASSINENNAVNAVIGTLTSTDANPGDSHAYSLVAGTGSTDNASFNISGNQLRASVAFNYEAKSSYSIRVRTNDGEATFDKVFTITINDVAEDLTPPAVVSLSPLDDAANIPVNSNFVITFNEPISLIPATVLVGFFKNGVLDFTLGTNSPFVNISGSTLTIDLNVDLLSATAYAIYFNPNIQDMSGNVVTTLNNQTFWNFTTASAPNSAPTNIALSATSINENNAINAVIGTLTSTDANPGDSHTYSLVTGTGSTDNASFNISGNQLRASAVFDYETKTSYSIRVRTSDGTATFEKQFTITINNLADTDVTPPTILSFSPLDNSTGVARDADLVVTFSEPVQPYYSFVKVLRVGGGTPAASGYPITQTEQFTVSGNQLIIHLSNSSYALPPYNTEYYVTIDNGAVRDLAGNNFEGGFADTETWSFTTESAPNSAPTNIVLSATSINENNAINAVIGTLTSTDANPGDSHTYSLVSGTGSTDNASFNISGNQLRASAAFNHEIKSSYSIRVRSSDGSANFEKAFTITVNDVNEAPINYSLSSHTIDEGNAVGDVVGTFSTVDLDDGDSHTYSLQSGSGDTNNASFSIVGNALKANIVFTYLTKSSYSVRVRSTDAGGLFVEQALLITINSTDEDAPVITALSPVNSATAVAFQPNLLITFNEDVDLNTASSSAFFQIRTVSGNFLEQQIDWSSSHVEVVNGNQISITGIEPLSANTEFWVRAYSLDNVFVTDALGNELPPWNNDNTFWRFTTDKQEQTITFPIIDDKTFGDAAFSLNAEASSGLPVTYGVIEGNATVLNGILTITGAGEVTVRATQAGDGDHKAAVAVERTFMVNKAGQAISADPISNKTIMDIPFAVSATVGSGLPLTFVVSGPATNVGNQITLTGVAGEVTVTITQAGNANYLAAENKVLTFLVTDPAKTDQTITFAAISDKTYGDIFTLSASSNSGLAVDYQLVSGPASLNGSELTLTGLGTVTVKATQAGDDDYNPAAQVTRSFEVGKAMLTVTAGNKQMTYGGTLPDLTYTVTGFVNSETADVIVGGIEATTEASASSDAGDYAIAVSGGSADNYELNYVEGTLTIGKADQLITFGALEAKTFGDASFELSATVDTGLELTYSASEEAVATIDGSKVTIVGAGNATITVAQAGSINYNSAEATQELTVNKAGQSITFEAIENHLLSAGGIALTATASSGLTVGYEVSGPATLAETTLTFTGAGDITVTASQAGNVNYMAATALPRTFTVTDDTPVDPVKEDQTITFEAIGDKTFGDPAFDLMATASSGLPVSYTVTGSATISGSTATITGAGSVTITASQTGDDSFNAAANVTQSFIVNKATATITLSDLEQEADGAPKMPTAVTDPAGLEVVFTFNGEAIIPVAAGSYTVVATISDTNYQGIAEAVFELTEAVETGVDDELSQVLVYPNPFTEAIKIEGKNLSAIRLHNLNGQLMLERAATDKIELTIPDLVPGVYLLYLVDEEGRSTVKRMVKK